MLILRLSKAFPSSNATFDKPIRVARRKPRKNTLISSLAEGRRACGPVQLFPSWPVLCNSNFLTSIYQKKRVNGIHRPLSTCVARRPYPPGCEAAKNTEPVTFGAVFFSPSQITCGKCTKTVTTTNYFGNFFLNGANPACNKYFVL